MGRMALCEVRGLLNEFLDRLSGDKANEWAEIFKTVFRKDLDVQALIEKLGGIEGIRRFLAGELILTPAPLLTPVATKSVSAITKFSFKETFGAEAPKVKLYLGDTFKKVFGNRIEESIPAGELASHTLTKNSLDAPILSELGNKPEISLAHVWELLSQRPNGEPGFLLTNGNWNICHIEDDQGNLWAVYAYWNAFYGYWRVDACSVAYPLSWVVGYRVVSRKM